MSSRSPKTPKSTKTKSSSPKSSRRTVAPKTRAAVPKRRGGPAFLTKRHCISWTKDPWHNPITGKPIKYGGPTYVSYIKSCKKHGIKDLALRASLARCTNKGILDLITLENNEFVDMPISEIKKLVRLDKSGNCFMAEDLNSLYKVFMDEGGQGELPKDPLSTHRFTKADVKRIKRKMKELHPTYESPRVPPPLNPEGTMFAAIDYTRFLISVNVCDKGIYEPALGYNDHDMMLTSIIRTFGFIPKWSPVGKGGNEIPFLEENHSTDKLLSNLQKLWDAGKLLTDSTNRMSDTGISKLDKLPDIAGAGGYRWLQGGMVDTGTGPMFLPDNMGDFVELCNQVQAAVDERL